MGIVGFSKSGAFIFDLFHFFHGLTGTLLHFRTETEKGADPIPRLLQNRNYDAAEKLAGFFRGEKVFWFFVTTNKTITQLTSSILDNESLHFFRSSNSRHDYL